MNYLIYSSDISCAFQFKKAKKILREELRLELWSIDLHDRDRVVKIRTEVGERNEMEVLKQIKSHGINFSLLED